MKKLLLFLLLSCSLNFAQNLVKEKEIGPGVNYRIYIDSEKPLYYCVIEADLNNPKVKIGVGLANDRIGFGGEGTSQFSKRRLESGEYILGAVNGDFFGGDPWQAENSSASDGEIFKGISHRNRSLFGIDENGQPFSGVLKYSGFLFEGSDTLFLNSFNYNKEAGVGLFYYLCTPVTKVDSGYTGYVLNKKTENRLVVGNELPAGQEILLTEDRYLLRVPEGTAIPFESWDKVTLEHRFNDNLTNIQTLIGGLPYLIRNGEIPKTYIGLEGLSSERFVDVNPRTAVGFNKERNKVYIVAVDGRNVNISAGIPLLDLAAFMKGLGCYEAVNLDGGGSTTMTVRDEIVNHPSDATGERPVHNFLYVAANDAQKNYLKEIKFTQDTLHVKKGEFFNPDFVFYDMWGFELLDTSFVVDFHVSDEIQETEKGLVIYEEGIYELPASSGTLTDTLVISVKGE
ncbi:MAG: hypothetical protein SCALA702_05580 [Melioribacteraceae bacterium]|nr:MAG: hypothetical protein SCALA702_05580 [Melioribacteraceae bacterium]